MSPDLAIHRCNHAKVNKFIYNAECLNVVWHERFIFLAYDQYVLSGNDPIDEDVDIGGNDVPISSFPPVEIEKDTVLRNSKCSSSSSSSSESGSSSSGLFTVTFTSILLPINSYA